MHKGVRSLAVQVQGCCPVTAHSRTFFRAKNSARTLLAIDIDQATEITHERTPSTTSRRITLVRSG